MLFVYYVDLLSIQTKEAFTFYLSCVTEKIKSDMISRQFLQDIDYFIICTTESDRSNSYDYKTFSAETGIHYLNHDEKLACMSLTMHELSSLPRDQEKKHIHLLSIMQHLSAFYKDNPSKLTDVNHLIDILEWERDPHLIYTMYLLSHFEYRAFNIGIMLFKLTMLYPENNLQYGNHSSILDECCLNQDKLTLLSEMIPKNILLELNLPIINASKVIEGEGLHDSKCIAHIKMLKDFYNYHALLSPNPLKTSILDVFLEARFEIIQNFGVDAFNQADTAWALLINELDSHQVISNLISDNKQNSPGIDNSNKQPSEIKAHKKRDTQDTQDSSNKKTLREEPKALFTSGSKIPVLEASSLILKGGREQFKYVVPNNPSEIEHHLFFARVAVLKHTSRNWGIFTEKTIPEHTVLRHYHGNLIELDNEKKTWEYTFHISEKRGLDAFSEGNWTSFVNSSLCNFGANVIAIQKGQRIIYETLRDIHPGEQLLVYYDESYDFHGNEMRFLKSTDSYLDSDDILKQHASLYTVEPQVAPLAVQACFNIDSHQHFKIPKYNILEANHRAEPAGDLNHYYDMPILAVDSLDGVTVLPQCEQENITPLMLAILDKDLDLALFLLKNGANPNIQTSIHGLTALHVLMKSSFELEQKKIMLDELINHGAILQLQDYQDQSILHAAIASTDLALVQYILSCKQNDADLNKSLFQYLNENNYDPFLYSLFLNEINIAKELFHSMKKADILGYFKDETQLDLFSERLSNIDDSNEYQDICELFIDKLNKYEKSLTNAETKERIGNWINGISANTRKRP